MDMVDILKNWFWQQPHFPQEKEEILEKKLKSQLRNNKLSLEKTKQKIDMYYAVRNYFPEFFNKNGLFNTDLHVFYDGAIMVPLKMVHNGARVLLALNVNLKSETYDDSLRYRALINYIEIKYLFDVTIKDIAIFDLKNINFGLVSRVSSTLMMKFNILCKKAYSDRIMGIHFLNAPSYFKRIVDLMKSIIKERIGNRIYVHENLNTLYEHIPRDILPKEYGGNGGSIHEIYAEWRTFLESNNDILDQLISYKSNEDLRPGKPLQNDLFGIDGSFRKLDID